MVFFADNKSMNKEQKVARKQTDKTRKMKHVQSLYYHEKRSEAEGKFMTLVNRYSALEKNQGHKPKGIILNFMINKLQRALAREAKTA